MTKCDHCVLIVGQKDHEITYSGIEVNMGVAYVNVVFSKDGSPIQFCRNHTYMVLARAINTIWPGSVVEPTVP